MRFWETHLKSYFLRERQYTWKKKKNKIARIYENITFCNTVSSSLAKPKEHTDGEMTP